MRMIVTGRHGQLVRSLIEASAMTPIEVVPVSRPEIDLSRIEELLPAIDRLFPDIVVNAAAYTAVDAAESNADAALLINGAAAGALATACARRGIPIIQISTDFVFDGTKPSPYLESDQTSPTNVYGASKTLGEQLVAAAAPRHLILRTSWLVSPFGQNFVKTMLRLAAERDVVNVVDDQYGAPTYAPHLAQAILALAATMATASEGDARWGTYHLTNGGETTWYGLAREVFAIASRRGAGSVQVNAILTSGYPTPARRPANSRLDGHKLYDTFAMSLPPWQTGIEHCVERLLAQGAS